MYAPRDQLFGYARTATPPGACGVRAPAWQGARSPPALVNPAFGTRIFTRAAADFTPTACSTLERPQTHARKPRRAAEPGPSRPSARRCGGPRSERGRRVGGGRAAGEIPPPPAGACAPPGGGAAARAGLGGAAASGTGGGGEEEEEGGRKGGKEGGRRWLACLLLRPAVLRRCLCSRAAAEANGEAALSGLPSGGGGRPGAAAWRAGGRVMPLTFLLALPFLLLLLLPLPALKLLFSPSAAMPGNFPEGWAQAGLVLRWAPQGTGHAVR